MDPKTTNLTYFNASPNSWTIHGYYEFRKRQKSCFKVEQVERASKLLRALKASTFAMTRQGTF
ncbi:14450_t:CDS:2 [Funneliformis mosseae]|uniref:14450_t:CDS:1 n=1 Tax=Funneliformis mosseae TaxID=27381 RepID=A0A9N9BQY4_FUNMO|nr:14450_t:CDS:2 [Funneliformis mosseae]